MMPNANGYITTQDLKRMKELRAEGRTLQYIADQIGCCLATTWLHVGHIRREHAAGAARLKSMRRRAQSYAQLVQSVEAFVPTFGGGRLSA